MRHSADTANPYSIAPLRPRIVALGPESLSKGMTTISGRQSKRSSKLSLSTFIKAPVEVCFDLVTRQLDETPGWDPTIRWVTPVSRKYIRVGNMSRVTFDLAGTIEEAVTALRSFTPNRAVMWTSNHSTQLQEEWQFKKEPNGTVVTVTVAYNPHGGLLARVTGSTGMRSQLERAVSQMLAGLKRAAETSTLT